MSFDFFKVKVKNPYFYIKMLSNFDHWCKNWLFCRFFILFIGPQILVWWFQTLTVCRALSGGHVGVSIIFIDLLFVALCFPKVIISGDCQRSKYVVFPIILPALTSLKCYEWGRTVYNRVNRQIATKKQTETYFWSRIPHSEGPEVASANRTWWPWWQEFVLEN